MKDFGVKNLGVLVSIRQTSICGALQPQKVVLFGTLAKQSR